MDSLLCDEEWLMSPNCDQPNYGCNINAKLDNGTDIGTTSFYSTKQDYEEAFRTFLDKEASFMPQPGYLNFVDSNDLIQNARFKAVNWFIKSQRRMNLPTGTTFNAVNYFDRFISLTQCQGWKYGMFELVSVACLSVASKFNETTSTPLREFQVEGLDNSFESSLIQKMELELLRTLQWRMDCITPFSYIELIIQIIDFNEKSIVQDLNSRVTELLLNILSDIKFLEFRPSVIAMSAFRYIFEDLSTSTNINTSFANLNSIIPQDQKDDLIKYCERIIGELLVKDQRNMLVTCGISLNGPSSPVTVLGVEWYNCYDSGGDLSPSKVPGMNIDLLSSRKRKREELGKRQSN